MRFFYIPELKKYFFLPAFVVLLISLIGQYIIPMFFVYELYTVQDIRQYLGYQPTFYTDLSAHILHLLFAIFNSVSAGLIGLLYFKFRHRNAGYTLLTTNLFHVVLAVFYLMLIYTVLRADMFNNTKILAVQFPGLPQLQGIKELFLPSFSNLIPRTPYTPNPQQHTNPPGYQPQPQQPNPNPQNPPVVPPNNPETMPSTDAIFAAVNSYRQKNGRSPLLWNDTLASFAQSRANYQSSIGRLDSKGGLTDYYREHGQNALGFRFAGEINSYGIPESANYLVEKVYSLQDYTLLSSTWTHGAVATNGSATAVVFGGEKL